MNSIYRLLTLNKNAVISTYKRLLEVKGLDCTLEMPAKDAIPFHQYEIDKKGSIFGLEDIIEYDDVVKGNRRLLIFNLFKEGTQGMDDFDTFTGTDTYCLTLYETRLPLQTIVHIEFYGRKMSFKVDDHRNLSPSVIDHLLIKNILVPAT